MKLECLKDKLLNVIGKATRLTNGKNLNLPILNCLFLETKDNRLIIKATNLEIGVTLEIPVKTEKNGKVAVPGDILNNLLLNLPESKNIKLEVVEDNLKIVTERNQTKIKIKNADEYPSIPESKSEPFNIPSFDFINGLKSVWYSCALSSLKPELSSVFIYTDDKQMVFAATDSFRLAEKRIKIKQSKDIGKVLIPFKNALEIARILEGENVDLSISLDKNQISLVCDNISITSRIIDGNFPDYKQIIPKEIKTDVTLLKQDFIGAFKVANVFSDKFNQVNIKVEPGKKNFEVITRNLDVGENISHVDAVFSGNDLDISFNLKYVTDCLPSIESDSLSLNFTDISRPMVIKGVGDRSFLYLVMPMNK
ncbi:MAG: DNA polymerase III subunit beta [Patescibacteria group bacterium]